MSRAWSKWLCSLACLAALWAGSTWAAQGGGGGGGLGIFPAGPLLSAPAVPAQFDITGFIQEATLDTAGTICRAADPRLAGGMLKVNDLVVIIPCNTVLQMPAATLTWQELFSLAPRDIGLPVGPDGIPTQTGLALKDSVTMPLATVYSNGRLPSFEAHVQGNIVNGRYIAGLIFISQQNMNLGQGTITAIDYHNGELQIASAGPTPSLARIKINDPIGRFGLSHGGPGSGAALIEPGYDPRFSIDEESPTIHADTGFPLCIPRGDPLADGDDPLCPQANRPRSPDCASLPTPFPAFALPASGQVCRTFMMPPPPRNPCTPTSGVTCQPDPNRQAPFVVGDFIDYQGTLKFDSKGPYISAHTIVGHVGIYTTPGTMPAFISIEMELQGTAALPIANLPQEVSSRVKIEGFTSDPSKLVDIYALDINPVTGATGERLIGVANPIGPPVVGRFRYLPAAGAFLPPTREFRVVSRTMCVDPSGPCRIPDVPMTYANGLIAGQYHAPNFEFIFPENLNLGDAVVPANFQDMAFLFCGSGPLTTPTAGNKGPVVGQLDPAPWASPMPEPIFASTLCSTARKVAAANIAPAAMPATITASAATPATATVGTNTTVTLTATATDPNSPIVAPLSFTWSGPAGAVIANPKSPTTTATFTPSVVGTMTFRVTVANGVVPAATADVAVKVNPKAVPPQIASFTATPGAITAGGKVMLSATASDLSGRPVSFSFAQQGGPVVALVPATITGTAPAAQTATTTFTAPVAAPSTLTFVVAVTNTSGASITKAVTVRTLADVIFVTTATWDNRQLKGKLNVTAGSTVITPDALMPPAGMTMTAKFWNSTLPATAPGSAALPMSVPMTLVQNIPGQAPVCLSALPCFTVNAISVIADPRSSAASLSFLPPTTVVVTSNLGGSTTVGGATIRVLR